MPELFTRKLSGRSKIQLAAAAVCAVVAFLLIQGYTAGIRALDPGRLVDVVAVSRSLPRGALLQRDDLTLLRAPSNFLPPSYVSSIDSAVGRPLKADLVAGEFVTATRIASRAGPVAGLVPYGLRAVLVPTDLPEGILVPGDRVDLVATYGGGQPWSETVATQVEILEILAPASGVVAEGPSGVRLVLLVDDAGASEIAHSKAFAQIEVIVVGATDRPQPEASPGLG